MIRILMVFVALLIAVLIGSLIFDDKGYVFIDFAGYVIEMNVFSMAIMTILLIVGLLLFSWVIKKLIMLISGSKNWLGNWGSRKKKRAFTNGLIALAEQNYLEARKQLASIEQEDFDGLNLLAAAEAELQLQNPAGAQENWRLATSYPKSAFAAKLCLVRDHLQQQQPDKALAILDDLEDKQKRQKSVLLLRAQAMVQGGKWNELKACLPSWKKALGEHYEHYMQLASQGNFAEIASKEGANQLKENWHALPKSTRRDPALQAAYIKQLIDQGMHIDAEAELGEYHKNKPHPMLLPLYRELKLSQPTSALKQLEQWLKADDMNIELLSTLGVLAFNANDLSLAEKALSKAIKLGNRQRDILLLARIKESQQDSQQALALYKQGLDQTNELTKAD
ncbi:heme biosynthesis HemY N-terminal domain-containing protein [Paraglaciecola polaris]|uniref:HemY protein n=1 Tax=Paraglaciecola polaris LMG 21857 TaxID=1129793 RepID=K7AFJ8_9ALTE|nr:heme biosynthesis HemY N-terminal domain-containing protein [Paraglaciecola polaris]GAC34085.1 HemY protein [Paraglaciecola polaris LMG 21857]|tara:strand:+ start:3101 stop:4282 length:1182 start_codon:yes stop_codon:yes gene_type:complete